MKKIYIVPLVEVNNVNMNEVMRPGEASVLPGPGSQTSTGRGPGRFIGW